jgi:hypothetical protein
LRTMRMQYRWLSATSTSLTVQRVVWRLDQKGRSKVPTQHALRHDRAAGAGAPPVEQSSPRSKRVPRVRVNERAPRAEYRVTVGSAGAAHRAPRNRRLGRCPGQHISITVGCQLLKKMSGTGSLWDLPLVGRKRLSI